MTTTTQVVRVTNYTDKTVTIRNLEDENSGTSIISKRSSCLYNWNVPWARDEAEFEDHHIELAIPEGASPPICIWQHDDGGDSIRYSTDGRFHSRNTDGKQGTAVPGESSTGAHREIAVSPDYTEEFRFFKKGSPSGPPRFGKR